MPRLDRTAHARLVDPIRMEDAQAMVADLEWVDPLPWQKMAQEAFWRFPECQTLTIPCCRQAGKTENARRQIVELSTYTSPDDTDLYIAPTYIDARRPWRLTERLVRQNPGLGVVMRSERTIGWAWGSVTQFRHGGAGDMTGDTVGTVAIVDEAGKITDELHQFLDPMFKRNNARKINYGSPRGMNRFYEDFTQGLDADGNSPLISGKPPINKLFVSLRVDHTAIPWHTPEAIAEAQRAMSPALFAQEYEAQFLSGANEAFPGVERLHAAIPEDPHEDGNYVIGYDPARKVDAAALSVLRVDCTPPREVHHWRSNIGLDWNRQFDVVADVADKYPGIVYLDATGLGDVVLSQLRQRGLAVEPHILTERENLEMAEDMVALTACDGILFLEKDSGPHTRAAFEETRDWQVELKPGAGSVITGLNLKYGHAPGAHDDSVFARLLAARSLRRIMTHVPVA